MIRYYFSATSAVVAVLVAAGILLRGTYKKDKIATILGAIALVLGTINILLIFLPRLF